MDLINSGCVHIKCMFVVHAVYRAHYFLLINAYYAKRWSVWYMILLPIDQYSVQGMFTLIRIITPYSGVVGIIILVTTVYRAC